MKHLYAILISTTLNFTLYSQQLAVSQIDEFTKKEVIQVNASKDKKWKNSDNIAQGFYNNVYLSLRKIDTLKSIQLDIQRGSMICLNNLDGKVIALFEDSSTLELPQVSKIDCAQRILATYYLPKNHLKKLTENEIKKIRIYTNDGYFDLEIKNDKKKIIKETFQLFQSKST